MTVEAVERSPDPGREWGWSSDRAIDRALAGGDAPRAWRAAVGRTVDETAAVADRCRSIEALGAETVTIGREPTFGRLIDDILNRPAPPPKPPDPGAVADRPRRSPAHRPPADRLDRPAMTTPDPVDGRAGGLDGPERHRPPSNRPRDRGTAPEVRKLPPRLTVPALRRRLDSTWDLGGQEGGTTSPATATPVGPTATGGTTERPSAAASAGRPGETVRKLPTTVQPAAGCDAPMARLASRIGAGSEEALRNSLRSVPRPGPGLPEAVLSRLRDAGSTDSMSGSGGELRQSDGVDGNAIPAGRRRKPTGSTGPTGADDGAEPASRRPATRASASAHVDEPADVDVPDIRHVTAHREPPPIPRRRRISGPAGDLDSVTMDSVDAAQPGGSHAGAPTERADDADLEQRMKQILDEAARRHGIEV